MCARSGSPGITTDSTESLVHGILQLNVLHTGRVMFQLARFKQNIRLTETRGLRLPDEPQEERNRLWAIEVFRNLRTQESLLNFITPT
ncbi:hypothetical protein T265_05976 [Opisthorchis viverrini]|uniref:Uncharacterized protein n=1 Tax=Opisthorchis viverrini TaxID=6198 RepID=A0A074ZIL7_OPIVI|nr:hypothetical protein T265_05976 [Opisthorchis viverrini]KER26841.1 hypothetical protein T265_05976 [Opisthorchis viverrini]